MSIRCFRWREDNVRRWVIPWNTVPQVPELLKSAVQRLSRHGLLGGQPPDSLSIRMVLFSFGLHRESRIAPLSLCQTIGQYSLCRMVSLYRLTFRLCCNTRC